MKQVTIAEITGVQYHNGELYLKVSVNGYYKWVNYSNMKNESELFKDKK